MPRPLARHVLSLVGLLPHTHPPPTHTLKNALGGGGTSAWVRACMHALEQEGEKEGERERWTEGGMEGEGAAARAPGPCAHRNRARARARAREHRHLRAQPEQYYTHAKLYICKLQ